MIVFYALTALFFGSFQAAIAQNAPNENSAADTPFCVTENGNSHTIWVNANATEGQLNAGHTPGECQLAEESNEENENNEEDSESKNESDDDESDDDENGDDENGDDESGDDEDGDDENGDDEDGDDEDGDDEDGDDEDGDDKDSDDEDGDDENGDDENGDDEDGDDENGDDEDGGSNGGGNSAADVAICKTDEDGNKHTIYVNANAVFGQLQSGTTEGACAEEEETDPEFANPTCNLLVNGGFETVNSTEGLVHGYRLDQLSLSANGWDVFSALPSWRVDGGTSGVEVQYNKTYPAAGGARYVELDSHENSSQGGSSTNSAIYQDVNLKGGKYNLAFKYRPRNANAADNTIEILFDGNVVYTASNGNTSAWQDHEVELENVISGLHTIGIRAGGIESSTGGLVDDVVLTKLKCEDGQCEKVCEDLAICKARLQVNVTYAANHTFGSSSTANMSDSVFVGNSPNSVGTGSVTIDLTDGDNNDNYIIDTASDGNIPGVHVQRGVDSDGAYIEITGYGKNHSKSREAFKANVEFLNADILSVVNGSSYPFEKPNDGVCGIDEDKTVNTHQPGNDQYKFAIGGSTGSVCSVTSNGIDRMRVYYELVESYDCELPGGDDEDGDDEDGDDEDGDDEDGDDEDGDDEDGDGGGSNGGGGSGGSGDDEDDENTFNMTGLIFRDANKNAAHDAEETGLAGIQVEVIASDEREFAPVLLTSDAEGNFKANLPSGAYQAQVVNTSIPADHLLSTGNSLQLFEIPEVNAVAKALVASLTSDQSPLLAASTPYIAVLQPIGFVQNLTSSGGTSVSGGGSSGGGGGGNVPFSGSSSPAASSGSGSDSGFFGGGGQGPEFGENTSNDTNETIAFDFPNEPFFGGGGEGPLETGATTLQAPRLPATGLNNLAQAIAGVFLMLAGFGTFAFARRRK
jgi:LPXTG-motif cell wall-anchored protein